MRKINKANVICFCILTILLLIVPNTGNEKLFLLSLITLPLNLILYIIASVKRYKGIKNELKEDSLYKIVAILNTIGLIILMIIMLTISLQNENLVLLLFVIVGLPSLIIINIITFVISEKLCLRLYINNEQVNEEIKNNKRRKNNLLTIILIIVPILILLYFLAIQ